jgi:hypothetical protein
LYTGQFKEDEFGGKGKIKFGSLDVYEGEFYGGRLEGYGTMEYKVLSYITHMKYIHNTIYCAFQTGRFNLRGKLEGVEAVGERDGLVQKRGRVHRGVGRRFRRGKERDKYIGFKVCDVTS